LVFQYQKLADTHADQAKRIKTAEGGESDDELGEDSVLLESPLDRIDPYIAFRDAFTRESLEMSWHEWKFTVADRRRLLQVSKTNNHSSVLAF
jgi:hypothetical protein